MFTEIESFRIRDCHDGKWWRIKREHFKHDRKSQRVRAVLEEDQRVRVGASENLSAVRAKQAMLHLATVLSGRRYEDEWVVCESEREIPGWKNVDWPGPCERTYIR